MLRGHTDFVNCVRFSPDGADLCSGSVDGELIVWDVARATMLRRIPGHPAAIFSVAFSAPLFADGRIATGADDGVVRVWDPNSARLLHTLTGHEATVYDVAFASPYHHVLASCAADATLCVWDTTARQSRVAVHPARANKQSTVCFPSRSTVQVGGTDGHVARFPSGVACTPQSEEPSPRPSSALSSSTRSQGTLRAEVKRLRGEVAELSSRQHDDKECVVCAAEAKATVFVPCGHLCCCVACAAQLKHCPLCQAEVSLRQRVFM